MLKSKRNTEIGKIAVESNLEPCHKMPEIGSNIFIQENIVSKNTQ